MRRFCLGCLIAIAGCDGSVPTPIDAAMIVDPTIIDVRFEPEGDAFYRTPWPSDARLTAEGTPDMTGFGRNRALRSAAQEIQDNVRGFATMPVVYFELSSPISESSLVQGNAALEPGSAIQLVDLSEANCGRRFPLEVAFAPDGDPLRSDNMLQVANALGTVLSPRTPYGAVILRSFGAPEGRSTRRPTAFDEALQDESGSTALSASLAPLRRCLPEAGVSLDDVAVATVFTTQDPVLEMQTLRDFVTDPARVETRTVKSWRHSESWSRRRLELTTFTGTVEMPIFQDGETPYMTEGGGLVFAESGAPVIQRWEDVDISVAMRTYETPPEGSRPVLVFMDGTGWDPWDHLSDNWVVDALAAGYIVMSFMPQFHGGRAGFDGSTEAITFNLPNPAAIRTNFRQEAAEIIYFVRLIRERIAALEGLPSVDTANIIYGGHSQGALCGAIVAAVDDQFRSFVFNGLSSYLTMTVIHRVDIVNFAALVSALYQYSGDLDRFSPLLSVLQMGGEVVDPHNYVGRWRGWPANPRGNHVFVSNGYEDATTTPRAIEHMTMAGDITPIAPPGWDIDPASVWDGVPVSLPVQGNATSSSGDPLTIATYLNFTQGHGTIYRLPFVRELAASFWASSFSGVPMLSSVLEYQCGDGADEDRDGALDCDDPDCVSTPPCVEGVCDNGVDDDSNGMTDCDDPVCNCRETMCGDGVDEDGDDVVDCEDPDCANRIPCGEQSCTDRMDGDSDGAVDCADSQCLGTDPCRERLCSGDDDDDGDGLVDCDDPECRTSVLCPELVCDDGADEDSNGLIDCADPDCRCERARESECANDTDDDGDGAEDCADADCALTAGCNTSCADADLGRQTGVHLFSATLEDAGNDYPPGDCLALGRGGDAPDYAVTWTAPAAGEYIVSTLGSEIDTVVSVIAPDCDYLRELACDDDNGASGTSELAITLAEGESVVIVIGAYDRRDDDGPFVLHIYPR